MVNNIYDMLKKEYKYLSNIVENIKDYIDRKEYSKLNNEFTHKIYFSVNFVMHLAGQVNERIKNNTLLDELGASPEKCESLISNLEDKIHEIGRYATELKWSEFPEYFK